MYVQYTLLYNANFSDTESQEDSETEEYSGIRKQLTFHTKIEFDKTRRK